MKYIIIYSEPMKHGSPTQRAEIEGESIEDVILKFKESINKPFAQMHIAIFDDKMKNIYEDFIYKIRVFTKEEQDIINKQESLPQRVDRVKSILRDCGIRIKVVSYDYESEITFEYKGEKILDEDDCIIDMYEDQRCDGDEENE